ncbi:hypothetical protein FS837_002522 [Tulasnella sp. UAMH 9824]|nr:hypothetical protein FS837_002522 [Tulasnella sp. UAMH 9824]
MLSPGCNDPTEAISTQSPVGFTPWGASFSRLSQAEAPYPLQNGSDSRYRAMEEEPQERNAKAIAAPADHLDQQKLLSGKQFPSKLYRMLEDKTVEPYAKWLKTEHGDAFLIPDTEAFVANVMPKHFKEMTQWNSFQKQLNNYGFEKRDRGQGKALYAHSGNKFCQGRPDLLHEVLRRPSWQANVCTRQALGPEQSTHTSPAPDSTTPESGSRVDHLEYKNKELKMEILELKREFEKRQSATEERLQATENQLQMTQQRVFEMEKQLLELSRKREREFVGDAALYSAVDLGRAGPMDNVDVPYNGLNIPATADGEFSTYYINSLQSAPSFEPSPPTEIAYNTVDPSFASAFLAP